MQRRKSTLILIAILFFAFITRIYRLHLPEKYVFDEVYHAVSAKLIARNDPRAFEWWHGPTEPDTAIDWLHPPLAKYTQATFIKLFGETSFAWRLSSVFFGVGVIWLTYLLAQELFTNQKISLLAALLASLDGLLLTQSRIAMNDIHVTFFILLTLFFYFKFLKLKKKKFFWLTGLAAGLAIGSKWSGAFVIMGIGLKEAIQLSQKLWQKKIKARVYLKNGLERILILGIVPVVIYFASYGQMFFQGKNLQHFYKLHQQIWWYQTNLEATHPYQSRPWEWFLNLRPVWFYVDYLSQDKIANIYNLGNTSLFWAGDMAIICSIIFIFIKKFSHPNQIQKNQHLAWLVLIYFLLWLPWQASPRIMFFYHYTPAVPLLCIILSFWLEKFWAKKVKIKNINYLNWHQIVVWGVGLLISANFILWYPQWTNIPMPKKFVEKVYFLIPGWK